MLSHTEKKNNNTQIVFNAVVEFLSGLQQSGDLIPIYN